MCYVCSRGWLHCFFYWWRCVCIATELERAEARMDVLRLFSWLAALFFYWWRCVCIITELERAEARMDVLRLLSWLAALFFYWWRCVCIVTELERAEARVEVLRLLITLLPAAHRDTLWHLMEFLSLVVQHSTDTIDENGQPVRIML